jgi:predicted DsbA family dithiol-disulfide isomerase
MGMTNNKMNVEIWSDIMCPFCYLGKRKFENALAFFPARDNVNVIWKSFQLNPDLKTDTSITIYEYLSRVKGLEIELAKELNAHVSQSAKKVGLDYNFDKIVVANTFKAHILLHFAKKQGKQNEVKERLLKAFFTEGKNVDDIPTLIEIGMETGLNVDSLAEAMQSEKYFDEVREDIYEAQQFDIRGVPFFLFDRKYGVSGAQESPVFLETLEKSFIEWRKNNPVIQLEVIKGESCNIEGDCN